MTWIWRYRGEDGEPVTTTDAEQATESEGFLSQSDAESWLGENWRELLAAGVFLVDLLEDERLEYQMPLTPAR